MPTNPPPGVIVSAPGEMTVAVVSPENFLTGAGEGRLAKMLGVGAVGAVGAVADGPLMGPKGPKGEEVVVGAVVERRSDGLLLEAARKPVEVGKLLALGVLVLVLVLVSVKRLVGAEDDDVVDC